MDKMNEKEIMEGILNSYPYPIVFVDGEYVIRYMNRYARYHYYEERGYSDLIGRSLFDCHDSEQAKARIRAGGRASSATARRSLSGSAPATCASTCRGSGAGTGVGSVFSSGSSSTR